MENNKIIPAILVALGLTLGGFFPGYYYYKTKADSRSVTVKGLAEKDASATRRRILQLWVMKSTECLI